VTIRVFQGEREMAADNKMLGQFDLVGIPPAQRGVPQVEVTFDIDANGIVNVSAKDKATNKEQQIRIQASGGLSDADIDQMVQDAEVNADSDKQKRETVEARNNAEGMLHSAEQSLEEFKDDVPAEDKANIETAIAELKEVLDGDDADAIKTKTDALSEASMKLGELAYRKSQEDAAGDVDAPSAESEDAPEGADLSGDDDILDADFTDLEIEDDEDEKADDEKSA
jgi:molecular chaperone DnaK